MSSVPPVPVPTARKLKLMVASSVYHFEDQLRQICAVLTGFGYDVWNSHIGTIQVHPGRSNQENCVVAAQTCDAFLGIIRPFYGSGVIGGRSIYSSGYFRIFPLNPFLPCRGAKWGFMDELLVRFLAPVMGHRYWLLLTVSDQPDSIRVISSAPQDTV